MIKTGRFYTVKILTMETIRTEKKTPKTASTLTLLKLSVVFASLASRDSLDSITEGQLSTSSRGNTILKRASNALHASGTWRSSSMLTCVISWIAGMHSQCIGTSPY